MTVNLAGVVSRNGDGSVADACAFGFRRYFSEQTFGVDFVKSIIGKELVLDDYAGPASFNLFDNSMLGK
jgi:tRNA(Glu) U13 pseudouridine synthase TruD